MKPELNVGSLSPICTSPLSGASNSTSADLPADVTPTFCGVPPTASRTALWTDAASTPGNGIEKSTHAAPYPPPY